MTTRSIIYPVKAEPVLTDAQRPEQVTESRWHQPLALPVRLRALATAVVVASGLAAPVFTPAPVETVTVDKWHAALSQPVLRKSEISTRQTFAFVGSDTATDTRWFAPLSEPVRPKALATSQQDILAYSGADPFPETVSLDRWQQPLSQPTLRKPTVKPDALEWSTFTPAAVENVTLDKWFADFQRPAFPRGLSATQQDATAYVGADPFPETVSIDRWQLSLSEPVRRRALPSSEQVSLALVEAAPFPETVSTDRWQRPFNEPVLRRGLAATEQQSLAFVEAAPFPETVSVDRWQKPFSDPVLRRGLPVADQQSFAFVKAGPFPETVSVDRWLVPLASPIRLRGLSGSYQPALLFVAPVAASTETVTLDKYFEALSEPVRARRGLAAFEQRHLAFVKASPFAETVSIDRWLRPLSVPSVLSRRGLLPSEQQAIARSLQPIISAVVVVPPDRWLRPFAEPVRARRGIVTADQQHLAFVKAFPFYVDTTNRTNWPSAFLGNVILVDGYSHARKAGLQRQEMESGFDRVRITDLNPQRSVSATFLFSENQLQYFSAWLEYRAKIGEVWFFIDLPIEGAARNVQVRILGEPSQQPLSEPATDWLVRITLDVVDPNTVSRTAFDTAHVDDGAFPAAVLGDTVLFENYGSQRKPGGVGSDQSTEGVPQFRVQTLTPFRSVKLTWNFDDTQLAYFNAWLEYRARYGGAFFTIDLPIDSGTYRNVKARFTAMPVVTNLAKNIWRCSAELEVRDLNLLNRPTFAFYEAIGNDLFAIADAVAGLTLDPFFDAWELTLGYEIFAIEDAVEDLALDPFFDAWDVL